MTFWRQSSIQRRRKKMNPTGLLIIKCTREALRVFNIRRSTRELCQSMCQDLYATLNILRTCVLIGSMTYTILTRNENHPYWADLCHEHCVMISMAHHSMLDDIRQSGKAAINDRKVQLFTNLINSDPLVACHKDVMDAVEASARDLGLCALLGSCHVHPTS